MHDGRLSRGAVIDVGARDGRGWSLFIVSFVWGWGRTGYGPTRLSRIRTATADKAIRAVLDDALAALDTLGPVAAYNRLLKAVPGWGRAFFTKWLYFADKAGGRGRALILDNRVAHRLNETLDHCQPAQQTLLATLRGTGAKQGTLRGVQRAVVDALLGGTHATAAAGRVRPRPGRWQEGTRPVPWPAPTTRG